MSKSEDSENTTHEDFERFLAILEHSLYYGDVYAERSKIVKNRPKLT